MGPTNVAEWVAFLRDIVLLLAFLVWFIAGIIAVVIGIFVYKLFKIVRVKFGDVTDDARQVLSKTRDTVGTAGESATRVKDTVTFVSDKVVMPVIVVASAAAGTKRFVEALLGLGKDGTDDVG
ncbi:MAG: hypothetical protein IT307_01630 [Chloroflexi bacterium]|nr:hypothetical protein [Chloroflexota bacterium]